jgi:integrase
VSLAGATCLQGSVYNWFRKILIAAGIPHEGEHKGPRVHDLRHSYAVHALEKMARSGLDLYYSLPILSASLGHKHIQSTENYVRLTAEMYPNLLKDEKAICATLFPKLSQTLK